MPSREKVINIFEMFIKSGSLLEVNVTQAHRNQVQQGMQEPIIPCGLFDNIKTVLRENMNDTFSRFVHSSEYKHFLKNKVAFLL